MWRSAQLACDIGPGGSDARGYAQEQMVARRGWAGGPMPHVPKWLLCGFWFVIVLYRSFELMS